MTLKRTQNKMPDFFRDALNERGLIDAYHSRPAYQQNEYIGWITRAKLETTRQKRLTQTLEELKKGWSVYEGEMEPEIEHPLTNLRGCSG